MRERIVISRNTLIILAAHKHTYEETRAFSNLHWTV